MNGYQRAKRIAYLRGSAIALLFATCWMLAGAYAERITQ